jgi:hypothetical protein
VAHAEAAVHAAGQPSSGPKRGARARMHYFAKEPPLKQVFTRRNVHYFARDDLRTKHLGKSYLHNERVPGALRTTMRLRPALRGHTGHPGPEIAHQAGRRVPQSQDGHLGGVWKLIKNPHLAARGGGPTTTVVRPF